MKFLFSTILALFYFSVQVFAQSYNGKDFKKLDPEFRRQLNHDNIDKQQKRFLQSDGKDDVLFSSSKNDEIDFFVTQAMIGKVDALQYDIEKDTVLDHRLKVQYLHGLENVLKYINNNWKTGGVKISFIPAILDGYEELEMADRKGISIAPFIQGFSYDIGNVVMKANIFEDNKGFNESRYALFRKYANLYPEKILKLLDENPGIPFSDSLVIVAAYKYPRQLYDYASANNRLGFAIRKIDDPLVHTISKMATSGGSGQLYFPFLDNIVKGKMNFEQIDAVKNDDIGYFKLLVKTHIDYVNRSLQKEAIFEMNALNYMMEKKAISSFVNVINGLHESDDATRFRILQSLNAEELYYVGVLSDGIIYTSSYTNGVYPLMMNKIGRRGDSLLMRVSFDKYRRFIKMAAGYNTLSNFLASFRNPADASKLMQAFVGGLEKSEGLEDGVDVADSYASVAGSIKPLANEMLKNVRANYQRNLAKNDKRGIVIYNLLYKLFLSADSSNKVDISKELGIPPVYNVNYKSLATSDDKVVMQVFFYGDEDGRMNYAGFTPQFANSNWKKLEDNKQWIVYASAKGKPILVYANKPLDEESGELDKAQQALHTYLEKNNIHPTIVVHRGHSYWASTTISYIQPSARIVYMGSCGGYNLINDVLNHAPDAHIIASKQVGKIAINQPFFNLLMEKMRNGNDVDWISFWKEFQRDAGRTEGFEDYIPPYENLGAIFIKAYKIAMEKVENQ